MMCVQMDFWGEMMKPSPSVGELVKLGNRIDYHSSLCESLLLQQLEISPHSIQTIRRYATFLLEVVADVVAP